MAKHKGNVGINLGITKYLNANLRMISDKDKTKEQLLQELKNARKKIAELETVETRRQAIESDLKKFKLLCDNVNDLVYICDNKGNVLYVNKIFENFSGYKPEKFLGKSFAPLFEGDELKKAENLYKKTLIGESPQEEITFSKTGVLCEYKNLPLKNSEGEIIGVIGTARDISARKSYEETLLRGHDKLEETVQKRTAELSKTIKALLSEIIERKRVEGELKDSAVYLDAMGDGLIVLNKERKVIKLNKSLERLSGYLQEEIYQCRFEILSPEREYERHHVEMDLAIKTETTRAYETVLLTKEGRELPVLLTGTAINDKGLIGFVGVCRDITERKRAEVALQESEKKYRMLVDNMNEGLGSIDEKGVITFVNNRLCKMLGYSKNEMIGSHVTFLLKNATYKIIEEQFVRRIKGGKQSYELEYMRKDGEKVVVIVTPEPIVDVEKGYIGSFAVMTDITNRKQMEDELKHKSEELKSLTKDLRKLSFQFSKAEELSRKRYAGILHEQVGQNLAAIKIKCGYILNETSLNTFEIKEVLCELIPILNETMNSIRELTAELYPVILDNLGFIASIKWLRDLLLKLKGLNVLIRVNAPVEVLSSYAKLSLFRIVQETFLNIAKHAFATEVKVKITVEGNVLSLSIKDNGVGVDLEKIKERQGIGHMLMNERALSLGGSLSVDSVLGKGTEIKVSIPIKQ